MQKILTSTGWKDLISEEAQQVSEDSFESIEVSEELADFIDHLIEEGILEGNLEEGTLSEISYRNLQRYKNKVALDKKNMSQLTKDWPKEWGAFGPNDWASDRDRFVDLATKKQQKSPSVKVPASGRRQYKASQPRPK